MPVAWNCLCSLRLKQAGSHPCVRALRRAGLYLLIVQLFCSVRCLAFNRCTRRRRCWRNRAKRRSCERWPRALRHVSCNVSLASSSSLSVSLCLSLPLCFSLPISLSFSLLLSPSLSLSRSVCLCLFLSLNSSPFKVVCYALPALPCLALPRGGSRLASI